MGFSNPEKEVLSPPSRAAWRGWLRENRDRQEGVWLAIAKKHIEGLHYVDAVEEALCFGWIDSTVHGMDEDYYRQWYSPRKTGSNWSRLNKKRVDKLIDSGQMTDAGMAVIQAAKQDGSWEQLDPVEELAIPAEFEAALAASTLARENYESMAPSYRKQYLYWINSARREETRTRRVKEAVARIEQGLRFGS